MNTLRHLALVFLRIGLLAFGGGNAILPEMQLQVVAHYRWLTPQQFADGFALGQLTPGPAMLMVMFIGYQVAGVSGALVALGATLLPPITLSSIVAAHWEAMRHSPWVIAAQRSFRAIALGMIAAGAYTIVRVAVTDRRSVCIAAGAFVVLWRWRLHPAVVILAGGGMAALLSFIHGAR